MLCGAIDDPDDPFYPSWFGPQSIIPVSDGTLQGGWTDTWQAARDFYCRYAALDFTYSYSGTTSGSGGGQAGLCGDGGITNNGITEERGLVTLPSTVVSGTDPVTGRTYFFIFYQLGQVGSVGLVDYDNTHKTFGFSPRIGGSDFPVGNSTFGMTNPMSAGTATILGHSVPLYYDAVGGTTYSASLSVSINSYWPYDNGVAGGPPNGPKYDSTTGADVFPGNVYD